MQVPSFADPPFACPPDPIEIVLDLPTPPSANRLWRASKGRFYTSPQYKKWKRDADALVLFRRQYPRIRIAGAFTVDIKIDDAVKRRDGDNIIKALLDWCQSREIIRNDSDCRRGSWGFVTSELAPYGCRVILRGVA